VSVFRSAIEGKDGAVDAGYLGLYLVGVLILGAIPFTFALVAVRMFLVAGYPLDLAGVAAVIGAAGVCFGAAATGVGVFRVGDKERVSAPSIPEVPVVPPSEG